MGLMRSLIEMVSARSCTVLIHGESGTGKELVARQIHDASDRADKPFIPVDCTTLRDSLFESQLFGHVKGAFTGADQETLGFLRAADGGTVLLDEIGELPQHVQAKLLRFLQEQTIVPLGGVTPVPVNVRVIAATHRDLKAMVNQGEFRQDLYYRLNVVSLEVPPLRHRLGDVTHLAEYFLARLSCLYSESSKQLAPSAIEVLNAYHWPGNVRELANAIEHGYVLSEGSFIEASHLPQIVQGDLQRQGPTTIIDGDDQIIPLEMAERALITRALQATQGHQGQAAKMLQIDRRRLYRKVRRYQLQSLVNINRS